MICGVSIKYMEAEYYDRRPIVGPPEKSKSGAISRVGKWQEREDSNPRPLVLETSALTRLSYAPMVPLEGLEPPTRDLGRRRSIH